MHIQAVALSDPVGWCLLELNQSSSCEWWDFCLTYTVFCQGCNCAILPFHQDFFAFRISESVTKPFACSACRAPQMRSTLQDTLVCVWEFPCPSQPSPSTDSVALASSPLPMAARYKAVFLCLLYQAGNL